MSPLTASALSSALHLLALGVGLGAIWARYRAFKGPLDGPGLKRALAADNWWGIASLLWIGTGLWRTLGPVAKTWSFYRANVLFHAKMSVFAVIFLIELGVMIALIRWRMALKKGRTPDLGKARLFARLSLVEAHLVVVMVFLAAFMARGAGMITPG